MARAPALPHIALPPFRDVAGAQIGGKGDGLARILAAGASTLPFFVVTTAAFTLARAPLERLYMAVERLLRAGDVAGAEQAWRTASAELDLRGLGDLDQEIARAFRAVFGRGVAVAVRSSSVAEDGAALSYAGQFATRLMVSEAGLIEAVAQCWLSSCAPGAVAYQLANGQSGLRPMAVVVQEMAASTRSGVLLTTASAAHPHVALVLAAYGYCEGVVQGVSDTDSYWVDSRRGKVDAQISPKEQCIARNSAGLLAQQPVPPALRARSVLERDELLNLIDTARGLVEAIGGRVEAEWTIDDKGALYILQARPVTADVEMEGFGTLLDDTNINESFSGPTSRLTFSFAQAIYEDVFQEMAAQLGTPGEPRRRSMIAAKRLLSSVGGQVYYNMGAWHELLACLPFRQFTIGAWDSAVGNERAPGVAELRPGGTTARLVAVAKLAGALMMRERRARGAQRLLDARISAAAATDWAGLTLHEALSEMESLRAGMQKAWATNMANDLVAALWFRLLQQRIARDGGDPVRDAPGLLRARAGSRPLASIRPSVELVRLVDEVRADPALRDLLAGPDPAPAIWARISSDPSFRQLRDGIEAYCSDYGMRGPSDLKLEVDQPAEAPPGVVALIQERLRDPEAVRPQAGAPPARSDFPAHRGWLLRWLGRRAMAALEDREEFRLLRSRIFSVARKCFLRIGDGLVVEGIIDRREDIFHLTLEEVQGIVLGSYPVVDPRMLVRSARAATEADAGPLPGNFRTARPVLASVAALRAAAAGGPGPGGMLQGIGASPGRVSAEAVILLAPQDAPSTAGRVVVTRATDPGWVHLLSRSAALISERGNLLSHSAIVGRELGIPTIVGVKAATRRIANGAVLTVDGGLGTVSLAAGDCP